MVPSEKPLQIYDVTSWGMNNNRESQVNLLARDHQQWRNKNMKKKTRSKFI